MVRIEKKDGLERQIKAALIIFRNPFSKWTNCEHAGYVAWRSHGLCAGCLSDCKRGCNKCTSCLEKHHQL